ncbi:putative DNA-binding protein [Fructilactobacillus myrtifloralis]|uniref:UPF0122 protein M3M35_01175 n=1 Tax=Fructilactobacillus myrtifloralis TaxID=2940301 RepID=A0ABY5BNQ1_9LACO|nr:putative DNA-binding protein [Fructilactobacillus myrtifloralis]USS85305.1 putative DNA-binding protein [Fructilactobacillus myrtifloralis]
METNFNAKLEKDNRINALFDFYGSLLTPKQADYIRQYYADDLSLGEISENFQVSRQAVYDNLRRTEMTLEKYEERMGLYQKFVTRNHLIDELAQTIQTKYPNDQTLNGLIERLEKLEEN